MTKNDESRNERSAANELQAKVVVARFAFALKDWTAEMRLTRDVERVERTRTG